MYENFINLDKEKQNRIISAGFEIFAKDGYDNASTLKIAEKANISKGALFHYFVNKYNFYFYLYDIGVEMIMNDMDVEVIKRNRDFFSRIEDIASAKMKAMNAYLYVNAFFLKAYSEESQMIKYELEKRLTDLSMDQSIIFENIDMEKFRKNINIQLLSNLIVNFTVNYLQTSFLSNQNSDMEQLMDGLHVYIDMLKENFYKEEFL